MDSNTLSSVVTIGALIVGLILLFTLIRAIVRIGDEIALITILIRGLSEVMGGSRIAVLGCAVVGLICLGCSAAAVLSIIALSTCGTAQPVQLCGLVGR